MRRRGDLPAVCGLMIVAMLLSLPCLAQEVSSDRRPAIPVHEAYLPPKVEEVAATTPVPPPQMIPSMAGAQPGPSAVWIDGYWDFDSTTRAICVGGGGLADRASGAILGSGVLGEGPGTGL